MDMSPAQIATINTVASGTNEFARGLGQANTYKFQAGQEKQAAKAAIATGSRAAYERAREGRIVESNARAAMAAGGGSSADPGMVRLLSRIGRDAQYNSLAAMFEGEQAAYGHRAQANAYELAGKQAMTSSAIGGLTTILSGGSSIYDEYYRGPGEKEMQNWSQTEKNRYALWKEQPWYKRGRFADFEMDKLR